MTSHIFVALGMWDDVIDANRRAIEVVNRQRDAKKKPHGDCGHYPTWLHYAYLQKGNMEAARKALDACRASAFAPKFESAGPMDTLEYRIGGYAEMRAHHVASGGALTAADAVTVPDTIKPETRFTIVYGDVLAAAQRNDRDALKKSAAELRALQKEVFASLAKDNETNPTWRISIDVAVQEADALELIANGKRGEALTILDAAAKAERSMPFEFGPPVVPKPAAELLAEQLILAGRAADAAAAYKMVYERNPGRSSPAANHVH